MGFHPPHVSGFVLVLLSAPIVCFGAVKTDVVELLNGDRITCEIQELDRGKLTVKTDGIGTISIEWDDVERLTSTARFAVELASGLRLFGPLARSDASIVAVETSSGLERLPLGNIVRMSRLGGSLWARLDGAIDAGASFTQANRQTQWTFHGNVSYRDERWRSELDVDSMLTTHEDADGQTRNTLSLQQLRLLPHRWWGLGFVQLQQNEALSLDLRAVLGGGLERVLVQSNQTLLGALGGFAITREEYVGAAGENVAEAVAGGEWSWFTFDGRSTNLDVTALSFYALNREGRVRVELNTRFKSDIIGDLYWSINLFESYNSAPQTNQEGNDFGVSAAVGWSF
jgi:Protein of unknown function, DUF481